MRILIVSNKVPYPAKDGGAIATLNMALGLTSVGANVTLLSINTIKHYSPLDQLPSGITEKITIKGVTLNTQTSLFAALKNLIFSNKPYNAVRFESKAFSNSIASELKKHQFDIIQIEGPYLAPYLNILRAGSSAPIVLRAHNLEHEIWERTAAVTSNYFKKQYLRILAKRIKRFEEKTVKLVDAIVPITDRDAQSLHLWNPSIPYFVAPTGLVDTQFAKSQFAIKENSLFHIGGLDWLPNQDGLIWFIGNCLPTIREAIPNAKFYIAGRNAPDSFIKAIRQPGVEFVGEVENAQAFMQTHGVMVVPLLSGSGMRIKIVEGLASAIPIISTSIGAEGIPASNEQEIVIANTKDEITNACITLLQNSSRASQIAKNGCNFARNHFDNTTISQQLMEFYKGLLFQKTNKTS